jgi:hypothetical protein
MTELIVETKLFNLSTRGTACNILNSDKNFKSKCEFNIPNMIERDETIEHILFSIPDAVIPVSFYVVNENNCDLYVSINSVTTKYSFPYGNYTANTFITQFKSLLGSNWGITLSSFNSVFTVTNSTTDFTFLSKSTISSVMGFSGDITSTSKSLELSRCCNFLPLPRITLRCAELANTSMIGTANSSDVIITIPNNSKPNGQIYYLNQSQAKLLFRHHELSRFVISLTDDDGNFLNFNGISSFFTLQFDIYRKWMPKPPRFSNIIEYVNNQTFNEELPDEYNI